MWPSANITVRDGLMEEQPSGSPMGLSLTALMDFAGRVPAGFSTQDVARRVVRPFTAGKGCSYVETLSPQEVGPPTHVVAHHWELDFHAQLMAMLKQHLLPAGGHARHTAAGMQQQPHDEHATPATAAASGVPGVSAAAAPPPPSACYVWIDLFCASLHDDGGGGQDGAALLSPSSSASAPSALADAASSLLQSPSGPGGSNALPGPPAASLPALLKQVITSSPAARAGPLPRPSLPGAVDDDGPAPGGVPAIAPPGPSRAGFEPRPGSASALPVVLLLLDPLCATLSTPYSLYALWLRARHSARRHRASQLRAQLGGGSASARRRSQALYGNSTSSRDAGAGALPALSAGSGIVPLVCGGQDLLMSACVWEQLCISRAAHHTPAAPHAAILQEVTAAGEEDAAEQELEHEQRAQRVTSSASLGHGSNSTAASTAVAAALPKPLEAANALVRSAILGALQRRVLEAGAQQEADPRGGPAAPSAQPGLQRDDSIAVSTSREAVGPAAAQRPLDLAALLDTAACLLWASGQTGEAAAMARQCRDLRTVMLGGAHPLSCCALLHLGAVLADQDQGQGQGQGQVAAAAEAQQLLGSVIKTLDAATAAASAAATAAEGAAHEVDGGSTAPDDSAAALAAAQARYLLSLLLLRAAVEDRGGGKHSAAAAGAAAAHSSSTRNAAAAGSAAAGQEQTAAASAQPPAAAVVLSSRGSAASQVLELLRSALPVFQAAYGIDHPLTAMVLSGQAMALKDVGKLGEAEPLLRRALSIREACLGPAHMDTMRSLNNLAGLVEAQGNLEEAEALLRRTAEVAASSLGPNHPSTATSLSNLGVVLRKLGKLSEAEELFTAALDIRERVLGAVALDTAASLTDMTLLLLDVGRPAEAEPLFRRILDIRELLLGSDHPHTVAALCDLASLLEQLGREVDAEPLLRRAVSVHTRCLGPGHEATASTTRELAKLLAAQPKAGRHDEAERLYRRALSVMEAVLGPDHYETAITANQLALLLTECGRPAEAEPLFRRVLALAEAEAQQEGSAEQRGAQDAAAGGADGGAAAPTPAPARNSQPSPLGTAGSGGGGGRLGAAAMVALRSLADIAAAADRLDEAESFICRALVLAERGLGPHHPVTQSCAEGLAEILRDMGLLEDAAELYSRLAEGTAEEEGQGSEAAAKYLALYEEVRAELNAQQGNRTQKPAGGEEADDGTPAPAASKEPQGQGQLPAKRADRDGLDSQHAAAGGGGAFRVRSAAPSAAVAGQLTSSTLRALASSGGSMGSVASKSGVLRPRQSRAGAEEDISSSVSPAVQHSFASFVSSRRSHGGKSDDPGSLATIGSAVAGAGGGSGAHSSASSSHNPPSLHGHRVAGRVGSNTGPGMSRFRPAPSAAAEGTAAAEAAAAASAGASPPPATAESAPPAGGDGQATPPACVASTSPEICNPADSQPKAQGADDAAGTTPSAAAAGNAAATAGSKAAWGGDAEPAGRATATTSRLPSVTVATAPSGDTEGTTAASRPGSARAYSSKPVAAADMTSQQVDEADEAEYDALLTSESVGCCSCFFRGPPPVRQRGTRSSKASASSRNLRQASRDERGAAPQGEGPGGSTHVAARVSVPSS